MSIKEIGWGTDSDNRSLPLFTKNKTRINNYQRQERPPAALKASINEIKKICPNAQLRSITSTYNCYGMVFANRRTCIDDDELNIIYDGDGYRSSSDWNNILPGDIIVYKDNYNRIQHVGIFLYKLINTIAHEKIMVMSKFGGDGEYIHECKELPKLLGTPVEYWTERKKI